MYNAEGMTPSQEQPKPFIKDLDDIIRSEMLENVFKMNLSQE